MRPGENLLNAEGQRVQVVTHQARPGPHAVYNLEVDAEHVYQVGNDGLLVHNAYGTPHGYAIINKLTGQVIKFGVSRANNGINLSGNSVRGLRQLKEIAKTFGGTKGDYEVVLLRTFSTAAHMFRWEKEVVGIWKAMRHKLPANKLPKGINPFIP